MPDLAVTRDGDVLRLHVDREPRRNALNAEVLGGMRDALRELTRLDGADLSDALFLTRPQLAAARGDAATRIPTDLERPAHW